jgi:hypothetical protein
MFSFDRPKGQSARTPPPTLLFSLHLSKNRCLVRDEDKPRINSLLKGTSFWRLRQPVRENRAADEAYLDQPAAYVNTSQKFLADFLRGFVNYTEYN